MAQPAKFAMLIPHDRFYKTVPELEEVIERNVNVVTFTDIDRDPSVAGDLQVAAWPGHLQCPIVDYLAAGKLPNLKLVVLHGVGYNHLPFSLFKEKGVRVTNTPGVLADSTAEMAMTLMLASARQLIRGQHIVLKEPNLFGNALILGQEVTGASLGIIGMGSIGYKVAQKANGFKMDIHYHNRTRRSVEDEAAVGATYHSDLMTMLPLCDFIVVSCPMTESTAKMIGRKQFQAMKKSAHFINVARGGIVDTDSLTEALSNGDIKAAALDVTDPEPLPEEHPLLKLPNLTITPHWASATVQTRRRMIQLMVDNARALISGEPLLTEVLF